MRSCEWPSVFELRRETAGQYNLDIFSDRLVLRYLTNALPDGKALYATLHNTPVSLLKSSNGAFNLELSVQDNRITAMVDGVKVMESIGGPITGAGRFYIDAGGRTNKNVIVKDAAIMIPENQEGGAPADAK